MGDDRVSERFGFQPGGEMMRGERGPMMDDMMMEGGAWKCLHRELQPRHDGSHFHNKRRIAFSK